MIQDMVPPPPSKIPKALQEILKDEKKRRKLIIYINPPYAEATTASQITKTGKNKEFVARGNEMSKKYKEILGRANNELFAQFFIRIYTEINGCILASFSTLKYLNSKNFNLFRKIFRADFLKGFISPANSFDNVMGRFPIGFLIWNTDIKKEIEEVYLDVFDQRGCFLGQKRFFIENEGKRVYINDWYRLCYDKHGEEIGIMNTRGNDFLNQNYIHISNEDNHNHTNIITPKNLIGIRSFKVIVLLSLFFMVKTKYQA